MSAPPRPRRGTSAVAAVLCLALVLPQTAGPVLLRFLQVGSRRIPFESPDGTVARFRFVDEALGRARRPSAATDWRPSSACYRPIADPDAGPVTLLFEADELGGSEDLTSFEVMPAGARPDMEKGCMRLGIPARSIVTDRGLRLGLTEAAVERLLGKPTRLIDDVAQFEAVTERTVRVGGGGVDRYDLYSALTVTYRNGRVVAFGGALGDSD